MALVQEHLLLEGNQSILRNNTHRKPTATGKLTLALAVYALTVKASAVTALVGEVLFLLATAVAMSVQ